jgi:hypothetical protein
MARQIVPGAASSIDAISLLLEENDVRKEGKATIGVP